MTVLRCATHVVRDVEAASARFVEWLDYAVVESGAIPVDLAAAWLCPASAGRRYAVLQPASGAEIFLRFVEGDPVESYQPIRTYGWAAMEICVQDVMATNARMLRSPFDVIGPPKPIEGIPTIHPMQVRGADDETVYLTEIKVDGPSHGLPTPRAPIDHLFIMVLACADMRASARWFAQALGVEVTAATAIRYSMIAKAFELPDDQLHELITGKWKGQVFLELDQYPQGATKRRRHPGALPPGVAICTIAHPQIDRLMGIWATPPAPRGGAVYKDAKVGVVLTPEGALLEIVDGAPRHSPQVF